MPTKPGVNFSYFRRFARARCTAARRHGLLPSTARSSTPASAHAPLWLCTWPSWTRRVVTCHSAAGMLLSKHPQRPAAGSIPAQADARQGLLHGRALSPSQGLEEVRRASCHCILLTWLQLCLARLSPVFSHSIYMVLFSLHAFPAGVSILPHSPQARRSV